MVPKGGSSEEHFKQPVRYYHCSEPPGVPRLQAKTPTLLLTDEKPEKFPPFQVPEPVLSSQQLPAQHQQQAAPPTRTTGSCDPRIPDFKEGEDPESFFVWFKRIARTWGWQPVEWVARVVTLLTGKALEAYAGTDEEQSESYEVVKAAVLMKFSVREVTNRQRFRSTIVPVGETVRETYNRIRTLQTVDATQQPH